MAPSASHVPSRILLVDDNTRGNFGRKMLLEQESYVVETASSGEEALDLFLRDPFDLVVTDYRMKKMDGLELIAQLRRQPVAVPIVLLSGFVEMIGMDARSTGADVVLNKGNKEDEYLLRTVRQLLERGRRRKPARAAKASVATSG
ncbi:response regulator [Nevskia soli]|jgi:CheY-like chemotaxis protein|uniref:response regulator n=1 Tax=Nevskia soli TaxID=418856 RepID=UPI0015D70BCF|nr:response regulator [Nevskia soli]